MIRLLLLSLLLIVAAGVYLVQRWTNPGMVRDLVLQTLAAEVPSMEVRLGSAEFRLLGGVRLQDLRCTRRSQPDEEEFAILPETVIYPDKEKLTRGRLGVRKVICRRPTLTLVRDAQGRLNLEELKLPTQHAPAGDLPLIEIEAATLIIHDLACAGPPLRLTQGNFELTPAGGQSYAVSGSAQLDLLGPCEVEGRIGLAAGGSHLRLRLPALILAEPLFECVQRYWPDWRKLQLELAGHVDLTIDVSLAGDGSVPTFRALADLRQGFVHHPQLPGPIADLSGQLQYSGRQVQFRELKGRFRDGHIEAEGHVTTEGDADIKLAAHAVRIDPRVYDKLPGALARLCHEYQPDGAIDGKARVRWIQQKLELAYQAHPRRMKILFEDFPYPVSQVQGDIHYDEPGGEPRMTMALAGEASGQPVQLRGTLFGLGLRPDNDFKCGFDLCLAGDNLPIDATLQAALEPYPFTARTLRQFHASGRFDVKARLARAAGTVPRQREPLRKEIVASIKNASFKFDEFPYPLEQGQANLTIFSDDSWKFENLSATRQGGWIFGSGQMRPTPQGDWLRVELRAVNVPLDAVLKEAVPREAKEAWDQVRPAGRVDGTAIVQQVLGSGPADVELSLQPRRCSIRPVFFPYLMEQVEGGIHYHRDTLTLRQVSAQHGPARLRVDEGVIRFLPNGAIQAKLLPLRADGLPVDEELLEAVPRLLRGTLETLRPDRPVAVLANLALETDGGSRPWKCGWNGLVDLRDTAMHAGLELTQVTGRVSLRGMHDGQRLRAWGRADLAQAVILNQPVQALGTDLTLTEDQIKLTGLAGELHGGKLRGEIDVLLKDPLVFETRLRADRVDLNAVASSALQKPTSAAGKLSLGMVLQGRGKEVRSLRGHGWLRIQEGAHLCELPIVLEIVNHFSRLLPSSTSFQDATAMVDVEGERLRVSRFDLLSDAMSLRGNGGVNLDGSDLNLEMFGMPYGRTLPGLPPLLDRIPPTLSKQMLRIRALGRLDAVEVRTEPLPMLIDPIKDMVKTFGEQPQQPAPAALQGFDPGPPPGLESRR